MKSILEDFALTLTYEINFPVGIEFYRKLKFITPFQKAFLGFNLSKIKPTENK